MADEVRRLLERMLPELDDYEDKGIFTREEVKQIVKRRSDFEYKLQRRSVRLGDYERYVAYENALQALVKKRKARLYITSTGPHNDAPKAHINLIYERALMKFPGNIDLWRSALKQAKKNKSYQFSSRLLARSLELHPRKERFWVQAGAFEFEQNNDILAARSLMQRGLRINKDSTALWCEYFRLELLYLNKLRERRKVLGIDKEDEVHSQTNTNSDIPEVEPEADKASSNGEQRNAEDGQKELQSEILYQGKLPQIVYANAVKARPEDIEFRVKLAEVAADFFSTLVEKVARTLVARIWADTEADGEASKREDYWNMRAQFEFKHGQANLDALVDDCLTPSENQALTVLKRGEKHCSNVPMLHQYTLEFLLVRLLDTPAADQQRKKSLVKLMRQTAKSDKDLTEASCEILFKADSSSNMLQFCLKKNPRHAGVLKRLLEGAMALSDEIQEAFSNYLEGHPTDNGADDVEAMNVWLMYLDLCTRDASMNVRQVISKFKQGIQRLHTSKDGEDGVCQVLNLMFKWLALVGKPQGAALMRVMGELHKDSVIPVIPAKAYENFLHVAASIVQPEEVHYVMDKATLVHPKARSLWLSYLKYERKNGRVEKESILLSRAIRAGALRSDELTREMLT